MGYKDWLAGDRIPTTHIEPGTSVRELIDGYMRACNGARLREACRLFVEKILEPNVTVGMSLSGALTPAGLGASCVVPLIRNGMVDWIVSTGANLYHDTHFALDLPLHAGSPFAPDAQLRRDGVVRIYDILFSYEVLSDTDKFYRELIDNESFQRTMGSAEFHYNVGKYLAERADTLGTRDHSVLCAAWENGVPVYVSAPADSSTGMNIAAQTLDGGACRIDSTIDVNETAAIVHNAGNQGKSAVIIIGGGSPKNFMLQTEPYLQEILGLHDKGHNYFIQFTDARPDTGGLSGATPSEAVSWGKVDPENLPDAVVCYLDATVALPLMTAYALDAHAPRPPRRLYDSRDQMVRAMNAARPENRPD